MSSSPGWPARSPSSRPPPRHSRRGPGDRARPARIKFSVIGLNHAHINSQTDAVIRGGGELVSVYAKEPDLAAAFVKRFPQVKLAGGEKEILESDVQLVVSAAIPDERAPLGIRVMQHGKDYMADKPGITSLEQLAEVRRVQAQTRRIYSIMYSERLENRATVKAGELVKAGAIGRVIQTVGLGPHRITPEHAARLVLGSRALRRHPLRHRRAPGGSVPLLHRIDARRGRRRRKSATCITRTARSSRTSAT